MTQPLRRRSATYTSVRSQGRISGLRWPNVKRASTAPKSHATSSSRCRHGPIRNIAGRPYASLLRQCSPRDFGLELAVYSATRDAGAQIAKIEPVELAVAELVVKHQLEAIFPENIDQLANVVPFCPRRAGSVGQLPPAAEVVSPFALPPAARVAQLEPAPTRPKMAQ